VHSAAGGAQRRSRAPEMDERFETSLREVEGPAEEAWGGPALEDPESGRRHAHAALLRVLPHLERYARRLVPPRRNRRPPAAREDLVQFAALVALTRLQNAFDSGSELPAWWRDEARLGAYMCGIMKRRLRRLLRDAPRELDGLLPTDAAVVSEAPAFDHEERRDVLGCLSGLRRDDVRLLTRYAQGLGYEQLAGEFGASAAALAKRRARALNGLRARCQRCSLRRESACPLAQARCSSV